MKITLLKEITPGVIRAFEKLIPQLSGTCRPPSEEELEEIVHSDTSYLFVAEENGEIIGTLSLVIYRIPTGMKAWIEDVVVDDSMRGRGIGRLLIQHAIDVASDKGAESVNLTSSPVRVAANRLYRHIGFEQRDTNVYRLAAMKI